MIPGLERILSVTAILIATVFTPVEGSYCYYSYYYSYYYCYYYYDYTVDGGVIAGAVIGALVGLACLVGFIIFCCIVVCNASKRTQRGAVMRQQATTVAVISPGQPGYGQPGYGQPAYGQPMQPYQPYPQPANPPPPYKGADPAYPPSGVPPPPVYAENIVNGPPPTSSQNH